MKKRIFINLILIAVLFGTNTAYANEEYTNISNAEYDQEVSVEEIGNSIINSIEIDGYDKVFDDVTGMYTFEYNEDYAEELIKLDENNENNSQNRILSMPDLSTAIISPENHSNLLGAKNSADKTSINFQIINQGNASAGGDSNFFCIIYINGTNSSGFFINEIPAYTAIPGKFDVTLNTWKDLTIGLEADSLDEVDESNEENNLTENDYFVYYCTHYSTVNPKRVNSSDLLVRVDPSAVTDNITLSLISGSLGAWNNITDECSITRAVQASSDQGEDITILGQEYSGTSTSLLDFDIAGDTYYFNGKSIITLYWGVLNQSSDGQIQRTIRHELGHAFGLGHAYTDDCDYLCLMAQSSNDPLLQNVTPNWHDKYNLYALYEDVETYNIEDSTTLVGNNNSNIIRSEVDYVEPLENVEQIENRADYILKVKILPFSENIMINNERGYTKTMVEVTEVYSGDIDVGDIINLREPYFSITNDSGISQEIYTGNYYKSEVGSEYIVFVSKYLDDDLYGLRFGDRGRYEANINDIDTLSMFANAENELYEQVLEKYN